MGIFMDFLEKVVDNAQDAGFYREQTRELLQDARDTIDKADDLYSNAEKRAEKESTKTQELLSSYEQYRVRTLRQIDSKIKPVMERFQAFNIDAKTIIAPTIPSAGMSTSYSSIGASMFSGSSCIGCCRPDIGISTSFPSDRWEAAIKQRDKADNYYHKVKDAVAKIDAQIEKLHEINDYITDTMSQISELFKKLQYISDTLSKGMKKSSFEKKEADCLKAQSDIAKMLVGVLNSKLLTDNYQINPKCKSITSKIKEINRQLPSAPTINDVHKIIDISDIIVY